MVQPACDVWRQILWQPGTASEQLLTHPVVASDVHEGPLAAGAHLGELSDIEYKPVDDDQQRIRTVVLVHVLRRVHRVGHWRSGSWGLGPADPRVTLRNGMPI